MRNLQPSNSQQYSEDVHNNRTHSHSTYSHTVEHKRSPSMRSGNLSIPLDVRHENNHTIYRAPEAPHPSIINSRVINTTHHEGVPSFINRAPRTSLIGRNSIPGMPSSSMYHSPMTTNHSEYYNTDSRHAEYSHPRQTEYSQPMRTEYTQPIRTEFTQPRLISRGEYLDNQPRHVGRTEYIDTQPRLVSRGEYIESQPRLVSRGEFQEETKRVIVNNQLVEDHHESYQNGVKTVDKHFVRDGPETITGGYSSVVTSSAPRSVYNDTEHRYISSSPTSHVSYPTSTSYPSTTRSVHSTYPSHIEHRSVIHPQATEHRYVSNSGLSSIDPHRYSHSMEGHMMNGGSSHHMTSYSSPNVTSHTKEKVSRKIVNGALVFEQDFKEVDGIVVKDSLFSAE